MASVKKITADHDDSLQLSVLSGEKRHLFNLMPFVE
jgi:hypothetical protein